jgi:hypothetical protein
MLGTPTLKVGAIIHGVEMQEVSELMMLSTRGLEMRLALPT